MQIAPWWSMVPVTCLLPNKAKHINGRPTLKIPNGAQLFPDSWLAGESCTDKSESAMWLSEPPVWLGSISTAHIAQQLPLIKHLCTSSCENPVWSVARGGGMKGSVVLQKSGGSGRARAEGRADVVLERSFSLNSSTRLSRCRASLWTQMLQWNCQESKEMGQYVTLVRPQCVTT